MSKIESVSENRRSSSGRLRDRGRSPGSSSDSRSAATTAHESLARSIDERLDAGDYDGALVRALDGYGPEILGFLVGRLRARHLADEAYASFAEAIVKGIRRFERTCSFRTWAYVIARREAVRVSRASRLDLVGDSQLQALAAPVASSVPSYLNSEAKTRLARARELLSEEERELLFLRIDRNLPWEEVSLIVSSPDAPLTAGNCRKRFQRLLQKLRGLYDRLDRTDSAAQGSRGRG